jgi:hypothetical protein
MSSIKRCANQVRIVDEDFFYALGSCGPTVPSTSRYLNADMTNPFFFAKIASVLCDHHPHYSNHLAPNGTIVVKLDKALYGCIESAKLWYDDLSSFLLEIGFKERK